MSIYKYKIKWNEYVLSLVFFFFFALVLRFEIRSILWDVCTYTQTLVLETNKSTQTSHTHTHTRARADTHTHTRGRAQTHPALRYKSTKTNNADNHTPPLSKKKKSQNTKPQIPIHNARGVCQLLQGVRCQHCARCPSCGNHDDSLWAIGCSYGSRACALGKGRRGTAACYVCACRPVVL